VSGVIWADDLFPDKNLEAAVRREVFEKRYNSEPITAEDVKNISQVVGKGKGIKSLEGLQHCKSLMKLDLEKNEISDLNPIRELKQLQSIDLANNQIQSLEPMTALTGVQYLQVSNNAIEDLSPLSGMSNLQSLYMAGNKIKKLEPVSKHKKLWTLDVAGSPIEDWSSISELKGLQTLNVKGCSVKSTEFIRPLIDLKLLIMTENAEPEFAPLAEACENDSKTEHRFAQFLKLYVDEALLKDANKASTFERLKSAGVRINPPVK
jgi:Leucine-rich repeat (LRR) protein